MTRRSTCSDVSFSLRFDWPAFTRSKCRLCGRVRNPCTFRVKPRASSPFSPLTNLHQSRLCFFTSLTNSSHNSVHSFPPILLTPINLHPPLRYYRVKAITTCGPPSLSHAVQIPNGSPHVACEPRDEPMKPRSKECVIRDHYNTTKTTL